MDRSGEQQEPKHAMEHGLVEVDLRHHECDRFTEAACMRTYQDQSQQLDRPDQHDLDGGAEPDVVDEARDRHQRDEDADQAKERHRNSIGWTSRPRPEETRKAGQGSSDGAIVPTSGPQCDAPVIARSEGRIVIDLLVDHSSYEVRVTDRLFWACKPTAQNSVIADLAG